MLDGLDTDDNLLIQSHFSQAQAQQQQQPTTLPPYPLHHQTTQATLIPLRPGDFAAVSEVPNNTSPQQQNLLFTSTTTSANVPGSEGATSSGMTLLGANVPWCAPSGPYGSLPGKHYHMRSWNS